MIFITLMLPLEVRIGADSARLPHERAPCLFQKIMEWTGIVWLVQMIFRHPDQSQSQPHHTPMPKPTLPLSIATATENSFPVQPPSS